jgi:peptidoglycan biosynthesis protein MviN/MurJ (putative lipid II flippase)
MQYGSSASEVNHRASYSSDVLAVSTALGIALSALSLVVIASLSALAATDMSRRGQPGWAVACVIGMLLFLPAGLLLWILGRHID